MVVGWVDVARETAVKGALARPLVSCEGIPRERAMTNQTPELKLHDGGGAELGRRMLRAYLEHRHEDGRALVNQIARRGNLKAVNDVADASADTRSPDALP